MKCLTVFLVVAALAGQSFAADSTSSPDETTTVSSTFDSTDSSTVSFSSSSSSTISGGLTDATSSSPSISGGSSASTDSSTIVNGDSTVSTDWSTGASDLTTEPPSNSSASSTESFSSTESSSSNSSLPSGSTENPPTTLAPVNGLQCYACQGGDCNEKRIINCPDRSQTTAAPGANSSEPVSPAPSGYACYRILVPENGSSRLALGCIGIAEGQSACQAVRQELEISENSSDDQCEACQRNLCNSSGLAKLSLVALLSVLLAKYLI